MYHVVQKHCRVAYTCSKAVTISQQPNPCSKRKRIWMLRHGHVCRPKANPNLIYNHSTGECDTCMQGMCIFRILVASGLSPASLPEQHTSRKHQTERQSLFCAPTPPSACSKEGGGVWYQGGGGVWYQGGGGGLVPSSVLTRILK